MSYRLRIIHFYSLLFIFVLLTTPCMVYSQKSRIDSLLTLLKQDRNSCPSPCINDTAQLRHLNDLAWEFKFVNPDSAMFLSTMALDLAKTMQINFKSPEVIIFAKISMAQSNHQIASFCFDKSEYDTALKLYAKAISQWQELETTVDKEFKSTILSHKSSSISNIGSIYYSKGDYPKALKYYEDALKICEANNDLNKCAMQLSNMANVFKDEGDYQKALDYYLKGLGIFTNMLNASDKEERRLGKMGIGRTTGSIGIIYAEQGDYPKALGYYYKSLKLKEEFDDKVGIADNYIRIGNVFKDQKEYLKSLEQFKLGLKIYLVLGNQQRIAAAYSNIGNVFYHQKMYKKALENYSEALLINEKLKSKNKITIQLANIGNVYKDQGNFKAALDYYSRALVIDEEIGYKKGIAIVLGNLGVLFTQTKQFPKAEKFLLKALAISDSLKALNLKLDHETFLSTLYSEMGDYKKSLTHYKLAAILKDTIFNQEKNKESIRKEMNFEFDKKDALALADQNKKEALAMVEKNRQKLLFWLMFLIAFAIAIISLVIFRSLNITKKQKVTILMQKELVEEKQKEILDSIHYAKRIQKSILPTHRYIERTLKRLNKDG